jgi:hypothetical protein
VEPPLLEHPAASVPASVPTSATAANTVAKRPRRWPWPGRAGGLRVRDCSAPPMGYSYRRTVGRRRGLPERTTRPTQAAVASRSAVGGRAEIGPLTTRPLTMRLRHHFCHVGRREARRD